MDDQTIGWNLKRDRVWVYSFNLGYGVLPFGGIEKDSATYRLISIAVRILH
jgi:hypothetical protein